MYSTQTLDSRATQLCSVELPHKWRQKYMHSFDLGNPVMAPGYEDYLGPVSALCAAAGAVRGVAHMTVDEREVSAGKSQRRPGPHVDGQFSADLMQWVHQPSWAHFRYGTALQRMAVIVAASVAGCRVWEGSFTGAPKSNGDLRHIAGQLGAGRLLEGNVGYLLSPDCVHESVVFAEPTRRTFLRIALPLEYAR